MKKFLGILVLGLLWCNPAIAATDIVDVAIFLVGILMFIGTVGVLSEHMSPVIAVIITTIATIIIITTN